MKKDPGRGGITGGFENQRITEVSGRSQWRRVRERRNDLEAGERERKEKVII